MKKNSGFSLIELIVVILIMGILVAGGTVSVARMHDSDVDGAANKLLSILTHARNQSVTKAQGSVWFELKCDSSGNYSAYIYQGDESNPGAAQVVDSEKIGGSSLKLKIKQKEDDGSTVENELTAGNSIKFHFDKSCGEIQEKYSDIKISGAKDINLIIIRETGRCLIEE